ncbi:16S rRNA (uracil(1498)-N(3))-methyltransferase [Balneola sp. MJW-20]|uniref:RsmE family RNA methyltransferase n=1 Tax=Gracilimonas aurantiaca TaxID=3234185 RepID=UPI003466D348
MENLFYVPAEKIDPTIPIEIEGQEARHISRVLRFKEGDRIHIADGSGKIYYCDIQSVNTGSVTARISEIRSLNQPDIKKVLAMGVVKKRDRLEFAVEKAVELGAWEICLFEADHSERSRVKMERIESIVLSAFKQSKRSWLPAVRFMGSLDEVLDHYKDHHPLMASMDTDPERPTDLKNKKNLLLVGPEGGFSDREIELVIKKNATLLSLGKNRLRAETAVTAILSQFLYSD